MVSRTFMQTKGEKMFSEEAKKLSAYWEKTKETVAGLDQLIAEPRPFVLKRSEDSRFYPCWIGRKANNKGNIALLIVKKGETVPETRNGRSLAIKVEQCGDYCLYHFRNADGNCESYVEFQNCMWARRPAAQLYDRGMKLAAEGSIPSSKITAVLNGSK